MSITGIILIVIGGLLLIVLIWNGIRRKSNRRPEGVDLYTSALDLMLNEEYAKAAREFRTIVKRDTSNMKAYIKLGICLREIGKVKQAAKVHQGLLYRQEINKALRLEVMSNLVTDYILMEEKGIALSMALNLLDADKKNLWALEKVWLLYRDLHKWDKAAEYLEKVAKLKKESRARTLALYKVQEGLDKSSRKAYHDARLAFKKALKIDPHCEAAYYYIADSYVQDNREVEAVEWWVKFADVAPEKAWMIFTPLQKILFNLGNFNKIEGFYKNILNRIPGDTRTITALAGFYERKGDLEEAATLIQDLVEKNPKSTLAKLALCKLLLSRDKNAEAGDLCDELIEKYDVPDQYQCSVCGHKESSIQWICPLCGREDTYFSELCDY